MAGPASRGQRPGRRLRRDTLQDVVLGQRPGDGLAIGVEHEQAVFAHAPAAAVAFELDAAVARQPLKAAANDVGPGLAVLVLPAQFILAIGAERELNVDAGAIGARQDAA